VAWTGVRKTKPLTSLLIAGAAKTAFEQLLPALTARLGAEPHVAYDTVGALRDRVLAGEKPAAVLVSEPALATLRSRGLTGREVALGRTGVGLALRQGAPRRPIGTVEQLREALLAAESIAWADPARGATAGIHFTRLLDTLGIRAAMEAKARVVPFGVDGVTACAAGEVELAVSQATEIVGRAGVDYLGPLPDEVQLWTSYGIAAVEDGPAAEATLAAFASPEGRAALAAIGFVD
jgi:molybdate transport system substrate-binding protein